MSKDEALDLALEVLQINLKLLEKINPYKGQEDLLSDSLDLTYKAITAIKQALAAPVQQRCEYCDGTGDVHDQTGEWRGTCHCVKAAQPAPVQELVAVARVDDLERGGRVRALAMGLALDAALYTTPPAQPCPTCEALARTVMMDQTGRDA